MQFVTSYFRKILSLLRIRASAAGLEVSDQVMRLVYVERGKWRTEAVRIAPGVVEKGIVKDAAAFAAALGELRATVPSMRRKGRKMNVIVSMSAVNIYSQVFTLPLMMEGADLDKAIGLNVQMVSPVDIAHAYYSWELLGHDETGLRLEIAAAFVEKDVVDQMVQALYAVGFITVGVESRSLALVRFARERASGMDAAKAYLLLDIDNSGIDFLIVRKEHLYFEYANQWADIVDEKGQVSVPKFEETLEASLRQVVNFYGQHWPDPIAGVILSAVAFGEEAVKAVADSIAPPVSALTPSSGMELSPEWFVSYGCAVRGLSTDMKDREINLSGDKALDTFHDEQLIHFMDLWRAIVPTVLGFLVVVLLLVESFLNTVRSGIEDQAAFSQQGQQSAALAALEASSTVFNQSVALVANAESQVGRNYLMIADINNIAATNAISIDQISFQTPSTPVVVSGTARRTDDIAAFKNAIQKDPHFGTVTLPLLNIQQNGTGGTYSFSMTFPLSSAF